MDFIHGLPKFGDYDSYLVVTCGLTRLTLAFPCDKKITGEQTVKILVEQLFERYGALRGCTLTRTYEAAEKPDGTSEYWTP